MAWQGTTEEFMQLMRGIPAPTVARFLMRFDRGIDWKRSTKASMAEAWTSKARSFSRIHECRDVLAEIVANYRAGQKTSQQLLEEVDRLESALKAAKLARLRVDNAVEDGQTILVAPVVTDLEEAMGNANLAASGLARLILDLAPVQVRVPAPDGLDQGV